MLEVGRKEKEYYVSKIILINKRYLEPEEVAEERSELVAEETTELVTEEVTELVVEETFELVADDDTSEEELVKESLEVALADAEDVTDVGTTVVVAADEVGEVTEEMTEELASDDKDEDWLDVEVAVDVGLSELRLGFIK